MVEEAEESRRTTMPPPSPLTSPLSPDASPHRAVDVDASGTCVSEGGSGSRRRRSRVGRGRRRSRLPCMLPKSEEARRKVGVSSASSLIVDEVSGKGGAFFSHQRLLCSLL